MAKCKHGDYDLAEGCPKCVAETASYMPSANDANLPPDHSDGYEAAMDKLDAEAQAVALRPGEDIEAHNYHLEAVGLLEYAKVATVDFSEIGKLKKLMAAKKKELLQPLKEKTEAIRDTYDYLMGPVLEAEKITGSKLLDFDKEQRRIRAEQEEINRLKREAAEKELKLKGEAEPTELVEVVPEPPKTVDSVGGSAGTTDHWKYEVFDFALLPDAYKVADAGLLNDTARKHHDKKEVPGVRFFNEPIISRRGNR